MYKYSVLVIVISMMIIALRTPPTQENLPLKIFQLIIKLLFMKTKKNRLISLIIGFVQSKKGAANLLIIYPVVLLFSFYLSNFLFDNRILRWE